MPKINPLDPGTWPLGEDHSPRAILATAIAECEENVWYYVMLEKEHANAILSQLPKGITTSDDRDLIIEALQIASTKVLNDCEQINYDLYGAHDYGNTLQTKACAFEEIANELAEARAQAVRAAVRAEEANDSFVAPEAPPSLDNEVPY